MARSKGISGQLREYLKSAQRRYGSLNRLAQACGVPEPRLSVFLRGGGLHLSTADRLAAFFGCELTEPVWGREEE